ncbi:hypothetical protein SRB17_37030 [Streptomyces sp. RB17]|uniref:hypothetical protein n=1 Tax=Streptomyces sp. RB17 TaxID=2585197 RepID=UPI0012981EE3|nr:hypothetical protein [Streptomyces sp. RB17]MQY35714.1 hypothetical protein [Streptomyces sp. RB17]
MLRTTTWTHGRRGAVTAASAAVVVLGGVLAACGAHGPGGGYVAVGSGQRVPGSVTPTGSVTLVPLDGGKNTSGGGRTSPGDAAASGGTSASGSPDAPERTATGPGGDGSPATPGPTGTGGRTTPPATSPAPAPSPGRSKAPTPADLSWGDPTTEPADQRWCQKVTVGFENSGGTAVRSGSVTFGTHVIGALGIDWGTVDSTVDLPVPIAPGAHEDHTWTVCVDAWRVPLGMHIETRDVSVRWK